MIDMAQIERLLELGMSAILLMMVLRLYSDLMGVVKGEREYLQSLIQAHRQADEQKAQNNIRYPYYPSDAPTQLSPERTVRQVNSGD